MTDPKEPKKRLGRPPRDPDEGPARYHLGLRFPDSERDQLIALQHYFNDRLREMGLPPTVTVSSMVKRWIDERLKAEMEKWKPPRFRMHPPRTVVPDHLRKAAPTPEPATVEDAKDENPRPGEQRLDGEEKKR